MSPARSRSPFRLARLQVARWGTFDDAFSITVPPKGLLVTGPSGSGKSSLLDAMAAVLVQPRWLSFNAAAQEGSASDRSRSLVSYIRGAYRREVTELTGEIVTTYLRPGATWSAVGLTYAQGSTTVQLIRLMHVRRSATTASEVTSAFLITDSDTDLAELRTYAENGLDVRRLRAAYPEWHYSATYSAFAARFRRRLGLASEQSQRLLHKTQSAKNLDSLDTLLREFMLDEPATFDQAAKAVEQFSELRAAHASVVDARRQLQALLPLRELERDHAAAASVVSTRSDQLQHLDTWALDAQLRDARIQRQSCLAEHERLAPQLDEAEHDAARHQTRVDDLQRRLDGLGGAELAALEGQMSLLDDRVTARRRARESALAYARDAALELPATEAGFPGFRAGLDQAIAEQDRLVAAARSDGYQLAQARGHTRDEAERLTEELRILTTKQSNLDPRLLEARELITSRLGLADKDLPLVGELLEVRASESTWRGAIERVLGPFARTLLVPEGWYSAVAELVNQHHLGTRLVYERVPATVPDASTPPRGSLPDKVEIADSAYAGWLAAQLARRFSYDCVEGVAELVGRDRAVTREGQVKHSATRHEKDDRKRVNDPRGWVLGFSVAAKQAHLTELLGVAVAARDAAVAALERHDQREQDLRRGADQLARLAALEWSEIDLPRAERERAEVLARIEFLHSRSGELRVAERELSEGRAAARAADQRVAALTNDLDRLTQRAEKLRVAAAALEARIRALPEIPSDVAEALAARFEALPEDTSERALMVERGLQVELTKGRADVANRANRIERRMGEYKQGWPAQAADLYPRLDFLPDFLALLDNLERDRLPDFEERFFSLLQTQSRNNMGALALEINRSRGEIRSRIDPINTSLRRTEYSPGRYLQVKVEDRKMPAVAEFMTSLREITSGSLDSFDGDADDHEARSRAEERFDRMEQLLHRLASTDPDEIRWRRLVLDTRVHVQFSAVVQDTEGRAVDYFTGAGGLSGGERQKLVTFCLAAALRYQLAADGAEQPNYALVALDEAFDKTDPEFTRAGLEVFTNFGFQLLLATPLKMLQTLEDYVGGAVLVLNDDGRSRLEVLQFDSGSPTSTPDHAATPGGQQELW